MSDLKTFLEDNTISSRDMNPNDVFTALKMGLENYYSTYNVLYDSVQFSKYFEETPQGIFLSKTKSTGYTATYFAAISFVHLFFELYIVNAVFRGSQILVYSNLSKVNKFINCIIRNDLDKFNYQRNSLGYKILLDRLVDLINHHFDVPYVFRICPKHHFLANHKGTLQLLSDWRNEIIHAGGKVILKRYAFELFFVNYLIPLINEILQNEERITLLQRNTHCALDVLQELATRDLRLDMDYNDPTKLEELKRKLKEINHLKELGRASYFNILNMGDRFELTDTIEQTQNVPKRIEAINIAQTKVEHSQQGEGILLQEQPCPCCGTPSLLTYINAPGSDVIAYCMMCTYSITRETVGEPSDYGIMEARLFDHYT